MNILRHSISKLLDGYGTCSNEDSMALSTDGQNREIHSKITRFRRYYWLFWKLCKPQIPAFRKRDLMNRFAAACPFFIVFHFIARRLIFISSLVLVSRHVLTLSFLILRMSAQLTGSYIERHALFYMSYCNTNTACRMLDAWYHGPPHFSACL